MRFKFTLWVPTRWRPSSAQIWTGVLRKSQASVLKQRIMLKTRTDNIYEVVDRSAIATMPLLSKPPQGSGLKTTIILLVHVPGGWQGVG